MLYHWSTTVVNKQYVGNWDTKPLLIIQCCVACDKRNDARHLLDGYQVLVLVFLVLLVLLLLLMYCLLFIVDALAHAVGVEGDDVVELVRHA